MTSGAVALAATKGATLHRKSRIIFVFAMLVMAALKPERISIIASLLTFYLVTTALLTVRRRAQGFNWAGTAAMVFTLIIGFLSMAFAIQGLNSNAGLTPIGFIFGMVAHVFRSVDCGRFLLSWAIR